VTNSEVEIITCDAWPKKPRADQVKTEAATVYQVAILHINALS
jgi:hypothetical protein